MKTTRLLASSLLLIAPAAFAHSGGDHVHGFLQGIQHPLAGWDHLLAMLAVGIWSAQQGGKRVWALPASFVLTMALGGMLGMAGIGGPWVESGILLSIAMLGLLVTLAATLPLAAGITACTAAALAHGLAHGAELPHDSSAIGYLAGFMISTAALHLSGIGLASLSGRHGWISRAVGAIATLASAYLLLAV